LPVEVRLPTILRQHAGGQASVQANGSTLARVASSSISVSMTKAECVWPTERHHSTGTFTFGWCTVTLKFGTA
jgi:hypothetical protein